MIKVIGTLLLVLLSGLVAAEESISSPKASKPVLPVIIKSELVKPDVCRLYFEDGLTQDISCIKHTANTYPAG